MRRYGLAGLGAGAGKDTVANAVMQLDHEVVRVAFADKIKEIVADVLDIDVATVEMIKNDEAHPKCAAMRKLLQVIGTEAFREYDPEVWVNALLRKVEILESDGFGAIVTDCRFPNEFDALEAHGFRMVDVHCTPEQLRVGPGHPRYNHASERALDEYRASGKFRTQPHITVMNDRVRPLEDIAREILGRT